MAQVVTSRRGPVTGTAVRSRKRRPFLVDLYSTSVGKKYVMGATGIMLMGFVVFHMIGNLKIYLGASHLNEYAHFLEQLLVPIAPETTVLWILRGGLIGALLLHLHAAATLTVQNRKARPVKYQTARDYQVANFASRTMRFSGIIVLAFIAFHLADLTFGAVNDKTGAIGPDGLKDVYAAVLYTFDRPVVAFFYIVANILLGIHLFHGAWSIFQSFGWNNPRFNRWRRAFATGLAAVVVVGNVSFPVAVMAGIVK